MNISTKSHYGLKALAFMANEQRYCSVKEIARKEKISPDYLSKILLKLKRKNILRVKRGALGGFSLAAPANKIKIGEIIRTLESSTVMVPCIKSGKKHICLQTKNCQTKNLWEKIQQKWDSSLDSITLADAF